VEHLDKRKFYQVNGVLSKTTQILGYFSIKRVQAAKTAIEKIPNRYA
jgi:hypothetical protein